MEKTVAAEYARLSANRTQFLDDARECAKLSVPYLMPPSGHSSGNKLHTPWQSVGARGVNVMSSRLMLSLFPVNAKFFKLLEVCKRYIRKSRDLKIFDSRGVRTLASEENAA